MREVARRAAGRGWWRGVAVRFLLARGRALAGTREMPKFLVVLLLARARAILAPLGPSWSRPGGWTRPMTCGCSTLPEAARRAGGQDQRRLVRERRGVVRGGSPPPPSAALSALGRHRAPRGRAGSDAAMVGCAARLPRPGA